MGERRWEVEEEDLECWIEKAHEPATQHRRTKGQDPRLPRLDKVAKRTMAFYAHPTIYQDRPLSTSPRRSIARSPRCEWRPSENVFAFTSDTLQTHKQALCIQAPLLQFAT